MTFPIMNVPMVIAGAVGVAAIVLDMRFRRLPNWLTAAGAAGGLAYAAASGWHALALAAAGVAVGCVLLLPFHWFGAMGGGDVKLMAAYGALLGPAGILLAGLFAAIFGGLGAAAALLCSPRERTIPYAPAIVLGAWLSLLGGGS
ncbi:MAG: A24 family peptidase [Candidatus Solibacter sp.]